MTLMRVCITAAIIFIIAIVLTIISLIISCINRQDDLLLVPTFISVIGFGIFLTYYLFDVGLLS